MAAQNEGHVIGSGNIVCLGSILDVGWQLSDLGLARVCL